MDNYHRNGRANTTSAQQMLPEDYSTIVQQSGLSGNEDVWKRDDNHANIYLDNGKHGNYAEGGIFGQKPLGPAGRIPVTTSPRTSSAYYQQFEMSSEMDDNVFAKEKRRNKSIGNLPHSDYGYKSTLKLNSNSQNVEYFPNFNDTTTHDPEVRGRMRHPTPTPQVYADHSQLRENLVGSDVISRKEKTKGRQQRSIAV